MIAVRVWVAIFGLFLLAIGIAGFIPQFMKDDYLFGIFQVDNMLNMIHISTGVINFSSEL